MDLDNFEVPHELKERVAQKLKNSGTLKQISRKIKVGMTAAIHELRNPEAKSSLELQIIGANNKEERAALQTIYQFLEQRGLNYTLSTLQQETGIPQIKGNNVIDVMNLINVNGFLEEEEEDFEEDE